MHRAPAAAALLVSAALATALFGCRDEAPVETAAPPPKVEVSASAKAPIASAAPIAPEDAGAEAEASAPSRPLHAATLLALQSLVADSLSSRDGARVFDKMFGLGKPGRIHQGNEAIAAHEKSRESCLEGLRDVALQTEEQRKVCGGEPFMVPLYRGGKIEKTKTCIDVFEYPNKPCELPMVWASPTQARAVCAAAGKRLCTQEEWILACRGDPEGGDDRLYAYGDALDLDVCNTHKKPREDGPACDPSSARSAYATCATDTEPSGSFPECRSRFGVFDQHGNVAEIMSRLDRDGKTYSQLKGSAFFYAKVARRHDERPRKDGPETYPDHCAYDPRWHVEPIGAAWHVNYHLGFRCCKSVP